MEPEMDPRVILYISNAKPTLITVGADIVALVMSGDADVIMEEVFTEHHVRQATDQ